MKRLGIFAFVLHYSMALISLLTLLSQEFSFDLPLIGNSELAGQTMARLSLNLGLFLTLGLSTHWSVYRADMRVRRLFLLLSVTVLILFILN